MDTPRILSCGEVLWDLFPDGARFGGAPANFACHAALLGARVALLSAVGCDTRGTEARGILTGFGIDTAPVRSVPTSPTGTVGVSVDPNGKPTFEIHADAAWDQLAWSDALDESLAGVDAVYFGTLGQRGAASRATIRRVLGEAKARGILRVLDINLRPPFYDGELLRESVALASVLKLSDEELPEVAAACGVEPGSTPAGTLVALRSRLSLDCIVLTRGAEGALLVNQAGTTEQPGIPTAVVDTVGAGDSFTAAFVLGLLRKEPGEAILRHACETASAVCAHAGAVPAAPAPLRK
jgi:fructokinase